MKNWFDHILFHTRAHPEAPSLVMEDRVVTYGMLRAGIERCARRIAALHIDRDGTVAVLVKNPIRHLTLCFALFRVGIRAISLEHGQAGIRDIQFAVVLGDRDARAVIEPGHRLVEVSDDWFSADVPGDEPLPPAFSNPAQICRYSLTSGTTGVPKLIEHPVEFGARLLQFIHINWSRVLCLPGLSSSWAFGMSCASLSTGRTLFFAESPFQAIRMIELFAIDSVMVSSEQLLALTRAARSSGAQLDKLRNIWTGGSVLTRTLLEQAMIHLCNNVLCRYGASETGLIAQVPAWEILANPGLVGRVLPGIEVGIFDAGGGRCRPGVIGAVKVRGDADDPGVTRAAQKERWIDLGDSGWVDAENQLYVVGRTSDVAVTGTGLSPVFEIEHLLRLECDFTDAAAVLVEDAAGAPPQVWIGVVDNKDATAGKIAAILRPRGFSYPVRLFPLGAIPRGANGKVNRQQLKAAMLEQAAKAATP
jgi:acyl-coenzyme A synthetase/AMP-(fatty) acid ligase